MSCDHMSVSGNDVFRSFRGHELRGHIYSHVNRMRVLTFNCGYGIAITDVSVCTVTPDTVYAMVKAMSTSLKKVQHDIEDAIELGGFPTCAGCGDIMRLDPKGGGGYVCPNCGEHS